MKTRICEYPGCTKPVMSKRARTCSKEHMTALRMLHKKTYKHTCQFCGKEFENHTSNTRFCDGPHYGKCEVCGKEFLVLDPARPTRTCCSSHATILTHTKEADAKRSKKLRSNEHWLQSMRDRSEYLNEHPDEDTRIGSERFKKGIRDKYDVDNVSSLESIKQKKIDTLNEHYGVDNPMYSDEIKQKVKNTNLEKYDVTAPVQTPKARANAIQSTRAHFGVDYPFQSDEFREEVIIPISREKWGTDYPLQSDKYKQYIRDLCEQEDQNAHWTSQLQRSKDAYIKTCMEKYGTINGFQAEEVKDKIKQTFMKEYGVEYSHQIPEVAKKAAESFSKTMEENAKLGIVTKYNRISKLNLSISDAVTKTFPGTMVQYEYHIPSTSWNIDLRFTSNDGKRSVLVEANPTISHNSYISFHEKIANLKPQDDMSWSGVPIEYSSNRAKAVENNCPDIDLIQLWSWDLSKGHMEESIKMIGSRLYPGIFYDDCNIEDCFLMDEDKHMLAITEDPLSRGIYDEGMLSSVLIGLSSELSSAYPSDHIVIRLRCDRWSHGITALEDAGFIAISDSPEPLIVWSMGDNAVISDDNPADMIENGWLPVPTPGFVEYDSMGDRHDFLTR